MVKILVVSDSHGHTEDLVQLQKKYENETIAMIHCGDSELDSQDVVLQPFIYVKGNCDYGQAFSTEEVKELGGFRFFITLGHLYNVNMTLQNISYKAQEVGASIVLFGHTHRAGSEMNRDGLLFINPGSISFPRGRKERTYVILELQDDRVDVSFYDHEGNYLDYLSATYQMK